MVMCSLDLHDPLPVSEDCLEFFVFNQIIKCKSPFDCVFFFKSWNVNFYVVFDGSTLLSFYNNWFGYALFLCSLSIFTRYIIHTVLSIPHLWDYSEHVVVVMRSLNYLDLLKCDICSWFNIILIFSSTINIII